MADTSATMEPNFANVVRQYGGVGRGTKQRAVLSTHQLKARSGLDEAALDRLFTDIEGAFGEDDVVSAINTLLADRWGGTENLEVFRDSQLSPAHILEETDPNNPEADSTAVERWASRLDIARTLGEIVLPKGIKPVAPLTSLLMKLDPSLRVSATLADVQQTVRDVFFTMSLRPHDRLARAEEALKDRQVTEKFLSEIALAELPPNEVKSAWRTHQEAGIIEGAHILVDARMSARYINEMRRQLPRSNAT